MIPFVKAHACGNDFLVVEESEARASHADLARLLCSRNYSVGADGIEFLDRREDGTFFLRLFNADGSEAELSGNGTRCVAAWLAYRLFSSMAWARWKALTWMWATRISCSSRTMSTSAHTDLPGKTSARASAHTRTSHAARMWNSCV